MDGGRPVPVTQFQNDLIFSFDISPDGKTLVCERGTTAPDVILLSAGNQSNEDLFANVASNV